MNRWPALLTNKNQALGDAAEHWGCEMRRSAKALSGDPDSAEAMAGSLRVAETLEECAATLRSPSISREALADAAHDARVLLCQLIDPLGRGAGMSDSQVYLRCVSVERRLGKALSTQDQLTPTPEHMALGVGRLAVYMDDFAELAWSYSEIGSFARFDRKTLFQEIMRDKVDATDAYIENFIAQKMAGE